MGIAGIPGLLTESPSQIAFEASRLSGSGPSGPDYSVHVSCTVHVRTLSVTRAATCCAGALLVAACGSQNATQERIDEANAYPLVSDINGTVPPGEPTLVHTSVEVLDMMRDGQQVRVYRDTRDPGTRSPIHLHPFGGWTCVVSGEAILYLEGVEPQTRKAGDCVAMPAMTPMSNVNLGPEPAVLLDSFATPLDAPVWRIIEVGQQHLGNEFASGHNERTNPQ